MIKNNRRPKVKLTIKMDGKYYTKKSRKTSRELFAEFLELISEHNCDFDFDPSEEHYKGIVDYVDPNFISTVQSLVDYRFDDFTPESEDLFDSYFNKDSDLFDMLFKLCTDMTSGEINFHENYFYAPDLEMFIIPHINLINIVFLNHLKLKGFKLVK